MMPFCSAKPIEDIKLEWSASCNVYSIKVDNAVLVAAIQDRTQPRLKCMPELHQRKELQNADDSYGVSSGTLHSAGLHPVFGCAAYPGSIQVCFGALLVAAAALEPEGAPVVANHKAAFGYRFDISPSGSFSKHGSNGGKKCIIYNWT